jgi:hypothetical protein
MSLFSDTGTALQFDDVEKPLLAGPFRVLDLLFTGGRVVRAFRLSVDEPARPPADNSPDILR